MSPSIKCHSIPNTHTVTRPWVLSIVTRNQQHSSEWLHFYPRISLPRPPRINSLAPQLHLLRCRRTPCIWFPRCNLRYPLERCRVELATLTWARPRCSRPIDPVQRLDGAAWNLSECTAPDSSHSFIYVLFSLFVCSCLHFYKTRTCTHAQPHYCNFFSSSPKSTHRCKSSS